MSKIAAAAFFELPAISFYLFNIERMQPRGATTDKVEVDTRCGAKGIFLLPAIAYQVMGLHMPTENAGTSHCLLLAAPLTLSFVLMLQFQMPNHSRLIRSIRS